MRTTVRVLLPPGGVAHAERVVPELLALGLEDLELVDGLDEPALFLLFPGPPPTEAVIELLGGSLQVAPARFGDHGSTWLDPPRVFQAGRLRFERRSASSPANPRSSVGDTIALHDGESFGTGLHPTTQLVVERLLDRPPVGLRVLDVGTGTGILALAALRLGAREAIGVDHDPRALEAAARSAVESGLDAHLTLAARLPEPGLARSDRVLANIDDATLEELAPSLVGQLASGGTLILSGVRPSRRDEVRRKYRNFGLHPIDDSELGGWCCLELDAGW